MRYKKEQFMAIMSALAANVWHLHDTFDTDDFDFEITCMGDKRHVQNRVDERIQMLDEEIGEVASALWDGDFDNLQEELVDVLYVAMGNVLMMNLLGEKYIARVAAKNGRKTLDTHYVNESGKIVRRK